MGFQGPSCVTQPSDSTAPVEHRGSEMSALVDELPFSSLKWFFSPWDDNDNATWLLCFKKLQKEAGVEMTERINKYVCAVLIVSMMMLNISVPMAKAEMISTQTVITASQNEANRDMVQSFLQRDDLRQVLTDKGINVAEAQARIDALSDQEVAQLAGQINDLPAGAGALGTVLGVALVVFIILLITDLAGATDVFPFVKK